MNPDPLLKTREVSDYLDVPESTLRYWRHLGIGPSSFRLGPRRVVYRKSDVDEWVRQQYEAEHEVSA